MSIDDTRTVHVVDDDESFRVAVTRLLRAAGFFVRTFPSASDFLAKVTPEWQGCVVADLRMPDIDGLALLDALRASSNAMPVVFFTGQGDIPSSVRAMRNGAEDFLEKCAPKEQLLEAITRAIRRDERERQVRLRLASLRARFSRLTPRESEVLNHVVQGRLNKQIAAELGIHERTVKLHRTSITSKLNAPSVAELTRLVQEARYFEEADGPTFPKGQ